MSSKTASSKHTESSSKKQHSKAKSKSPKTDDWAEISDPEERRRIQNRLAQRKFRKKRQDGKEEAARDAQNDVNAPNAYTVASPSDLTAEDGETSGLPWGGISMKHVVSRGHDYENRRGSGRGEYVVEETQYAGAYDTAYTTGYGQPPSHGSSAGEDYYYGGESPFYFDYDQSSGAGQGQTFTQTQ